MNQVEELSEKIIKKLNGATGKGYWNACHAVQIDVVSRIIREHISKSPSWSLSTEICIWLVDKDYITKRSGNLLGYDLDFAQLISTFVDNKTIEA